MPPKAAKLAGQGAFAAIGGLILLFAFLAWVVAHPARGGITLALSAVAWIALTVVFVSLIAVHYYLGHQFVALADGKPREV